MLSHAVLDDTFREMVPGYREYLTNNFFDSVIESLPRDKSVLIFGGAGSIGLSVVDELLEAGVQSIVNLDVDENRLADATRLVRNRKDGERVNYKSFSVDINNWAELSELANELKESISIVFNFAAIKHVRSQRNRLSLSRMLHTNIAGAANVADFARKVGSKKLITVSTDKATNPVNYLGLSKLLMERMLVEKYPDLQISYTRFPNVAFSNGSLLRSWIHRIASGHRLTYPQNIDRYFITHREAARLSIYSSMKCASGQVATFADGMLPLLSFSSLAVSFLNTKLAKNFSAFSDLDLDNFALLNPFVSDTGGEKIVEELLPAHLEESLIQRDGPLVRYVDTGSISEVVTHQLWDLLRVRNTSILEGVESLLDTARLSACEKSLDDRL